MDKRYQVFVSSTYADLKDERARVIQTLMEMDCMPAGMELFPAADEEQWAFIRRVISDCDYYVLIIGGRYGSLAPEGVSYTEKEHDYAVEIGLKVLAFLSEPVATMPADKVDADPALAERLTAFRDRVSTGRLVKYWKSAEELPGLVALSLGKTIKAHPAIGWIRGDRIASAATIEEMNAMRARNAELEVAVARLKAQPAVPNIAKLDETVHLWGTHFSGNFQYKWEIEIAWSRLFALIAPRLLEQPNDGTVQYYIAAEMLRELGKEVSTAKTDEQAFQTVKVQLIALGLVSVNMMQTIKGGMALFWALTEPGRRLMVELRSVKTSRG